MKKLLSLMAVFVVSLLMVSLVSAGPSISTLGSLTEEDITVKVNGEKWEGGSYMLVEEGETLYIEWKEGGSYMLVEEGETLDIEVELDNDIYTPTEVEVDEKVIYVVADAEAIEVVARLSGYEYSDYVELEDSTHVFDVRAGTKRTVDLTIDVPRDLTNAENTLRVFVLDRNGEEIVKTFKFYVESPRHSVEVVDVAFSPGLTVKAGRSLLTNVLVENFGDRLEDDVKVTVSIPELGISASEYVEEIDEDDNADVPELFLSIPETAKGGEYLVKVTAEYDNLRESVSKTYTLNVLEAYNSDKLVLAVGPESQNVAVGQTVVYGVALTNAGSASKAYTLDVVSGDWATASLSDNLVVLESGKNQIVYVEVTPNAGALAGEHLTSVAVKSGSEVLETVVLKTNVVGESTTPAVSSDFNLRNGLEIALIVLVVLLVIIGLIIGFSRLRKDDDDDDEQTYY